jgi:leader peptidase (prepilin peptidase)/N-methyltransferase
MLFCDEAVSLHCFLQKNWVMEIISSARAASRRNNFVKQSSHCANKDVIGTKFRLPPHEICQSSLTTFRWRFFCGSLPPLLQLGADRPPPWDHSGRAQLAVLIRVVVADGTIAGVEAITEAIGAGLIFGTFRRLYFFLRKIQGLGLGDVKFLAAATPWVGIMGIPVLLLIAAFSALIAIGGMQIAGQNLTRETSLPFGPFLAIGLLSAVAAQQWFGLS